MARVQKSLIVLMAVAGLLVGLSAPAFAATQQAQQAPAEPKLTPAEVDQLTAPIALYPDQLLVQILMCSTSPFQVRALNDWMQKNPNLKGSALTDATQKEGFDPSYVALAMFPPVVQMMAEQSEWTKKLGEAFQSDRKAVLESAQRLRSQAMAAGNLKTTAQQEVTTQTTPDGTQVIVIQPANPQVIYVPQYNPQVVYTQPATQTIVVHEDDGNEAAAAVIGFTAGVIVGAWADPYWGWGPYYGGGGYWYHEAWDDWYDHREDMWEDWQENRTDRTESRQENRTERQDNRQQNRDDRQTDRDQRQTDRQGQRDQRQEGRDPLQDRRDQAAQRQRDQGLGQDRSLGGDRAGTRPSNLDSRGFEGGNRSQSLDRSWRGSGGFSGYDRGSASRASSSRGRSSMGGGGGSRGGGGGGRSRGGGGRRR